MDKNSLQMIKWQEELDERLKDKVIPPKYWEYPELEKGNIHKHCVYCVSLDCQTIEFEDDACGIIDCRNGCGVKYHSCKSSEHR